MATVVKIAPDSQVWTEEAAAEITRVLEEAVALRGIAYAALSGGRTPIAVYRALGQTPWRERIPWDQVHWFWVDERWAPPDAAESNYGAAWQVLFSQIPLNMAQVHRIPTENLEIDAAAAIYEANLRELLTGSALDLAVMGMGADGHTASLFPGGTELAETTRWVATTLSPAGIRQRISLTLPLLNATGTILFLVTGEDKQALLATILNGDEAAQAYPAGKIKSTGQTIWLLDQAAAKGLPAKHAYEEV
jgi:6-phosphogluconolactonase